MVVGLVALMRSEEGWFEQEMDHLFSWTEWKKTCRALKENICMEILSSMGCQSKLELRVCQLFCNDDSSCHFIVWVKINFALKVSKICINWSRGALMICVDTVCKNQHRFILNLIAVWIFCFYLILHRILSVDTDELS